MLVCAKTNQSTIYSRWSISKSFYALENPSANQTHSKSTTTIVYNSPGTWFSCVLFHFTSFITYKKNFLVLCNVSTLNIFYRIMLTLCLLLYFVKVFLDFIRKLLGNF